MITEWLSYVAGALIIFIMVLGTIEVVTSKFFNWSIPEMVTFTSMAFSITVAPPLAYITIKKKHIEVDLLEQKLSIFLPKLSSFYLTGLEKKYQEVINDVSEPAEFHNIVENYSSKISIFLSKINIIIEKVSVTMNK